MKQYLHNSDALFDSPQYGWEQLQLLLEKNLPQKETNRRAVPLLTIFVAASLLILFLLSSIGLKNTGGHFVPGNTTLSHLSVQHNKIAAVAADPIKLASDITALTPDHPVERLLGNAGITGQVFSDNHLPVLASYPATAMPYREAGSAWSDVLASIVNDPGKKTAYTAVEKTIPNDSSKPAAKKAQRKKGSWDLLAGVGVNASIGEKQNLQPYPVATVRYNMNKKLFVALGAAVASPVSVSSKGISKTVLLNDSARNVSFYNDVKHYSRLSYVDIPLTAGVKIGKRFSVQAGVQASVLLNSKTTTAIDKYDFQLNISTDFPGTLINAPAVSEENYTVKAKKIDYRITGGVQYTANKASFHLNYQYAPSAALSGEHVSPAKNELISVGVQFKLK